MANIVTIDPTRISAYFVETLNGLTWNVSDTAYSICMSVTVGKRYALIMSETDSSLVGTIFRCGFSDSNTPSGQILTHTVRSTPQATPFIQVVADQQYLIVQLASGTAASLLSAGYLTILEYADSEVLGNDSDILRRREMMRTGQLGPLCPIPTGSGRLAGTGDNIVKYTYDTAATRYLFIYQNVTAGGSTGNVSSKKLFTIPAGVTATLIAKCTARTGSTALIASGSVYQSGSTRHSIGFSSNLSGTGTRTGTFTPETDVNVSDIILRLSNAKGITLELTLTVGDTVIIGSV